VKSILITRPKSQAKGFATALAEAGFKPILFPVIEIRPKEDTSALDYALGKLACYDWVVFTSINGVEYFWARLEALGIRDFPVNVQVAAIGPKTAEALKDRGVTAAFTPAEYVAEAILPGLGELKGRWVLLPRAEIARKALPEAITAAGGMAHEIAIYQTLPAQIDLLGLEALQQGVDVITFTSPSTVQNFITLVKNAGLDPLDLPELPMVACIGPITASAASAAGLRVDMIADSYTTAGLVDLLRNKLNK
jgi:uroporphyrinogen-III synthase